LTALQGQFNRDIIKMGKKPDSKLPDSEQASRMNDRLRCPAVNWASAASVSNVDWLPPTVRQLHGEPTG
jgi:hypothetical protein